MGQDSYEMNYAANETMLPLVVLDEKRNMLFVGFHQWIQKRPE
jgi:hypothetical protein